MPKSFFCNYEDLLHVALSLFDTTLDRDIGAPNTIVRAFRADGLDFCVTGDRGDRCVLPSSLVFQIWSRGSGFPASGDPDLVRVHIQFQGRHQLRSAEITAFIQEQVLTLFKECE